MLKPGVVSATFKNRPYQEVVSLALSSGLSAIEWSETHHVPLDNITLVKEIGNYTRSSGLSISSYGSYYRLGERQDFHLHLKNAETLGADRIRIWAGTKPSNEVGKDEYKALVNEAKELSKIARNSGIKVCLEWHKNTLTDTNSTGYQFLKDVDEDNFRTFWQPTQALSIKERKAGLALISPYLEVLHIYHWSEEGRRPFKEGIPFWKEYLTSLDIKNNDYYALLEFVKDDKSEQFKEDAEALKKLIEEI